MRLILIAVLAIGASCAAGVEPDPTPTVAPEPTPTAIPSPTPTPTPTLDPCPAAEVSSYLDDFQGVAERFDDANRLASSTPRGQLAPLVNQLQEIRREIRSVEVPDCAKDAHQALLTWMDKLILGYLAFLANDFSYRIKFEDADASWVEYGWQVRALGAQARGEPPPPYLREGQAVKPLSSGPTAFNLPGGKVKFTIARSRVQWAITLAQYDQRPDWVHLRVRHEREKEPKDGWFRWEDWGRAEP